MNAQVVSLKSNNTIWNIRVLCPFCGGIHKHGGGYVTSKPTLGERGSHCGRGSYILRVDPAIEANALFQLYGGIGIEEVIDLPY